MTDEKKRIGRKLLIASSDVATPPADGGQDGAIDAADASPERQFTCNIIP